MELAKLIALSRYNRTFPISHSATIAVAKILEFRVTRARVGTKAKDRGITQCLAAAPRFCNSVPI